MWPPAYSCGERTSMTVTSPAAIAAMNVAASMWAPVSMVPDPPPIMDPPAPLVDAPPPPSDVVVLPQPDRTSARVRAPPARRWPCGWYESSWWPPEDIVYPWGYQAQPKARAIRPVGARRSPVCCGAMDTPVLVVGEALIDIVIPLEGESAEHVGGSPANVAIGLARLGHPTTLDTRFGADERGERIRVLLAAEDVALVPGSGDAPHTSTAVSYTHLRAHETRHDLV